MTQELSQAPQSQKQPLKLGVHGRTYAFVSFKGGVGKTRIVAHLASLLVEQNKRVLCIDCNTSAPSLGLELGYLNPEVTLQDVLNGKVHIADAVYTTEESLHLIMGSWSGKTNNLSSLKYKISAIKKYYDLMLLDTSSSVEENVAIIDIADAIFCVMTQDYPSLSSTLKFISIAKERKKQIMGIILNAANTKVPSLTLEEVQTTTDCPIIASLPYEPIQPAQLKGIAKMLSHLSKNNASSAEYGKIVNEILK